LSTCSNIFPGYSRATRSPLATHIGYIISVKKAARLYEVEGMRGNAEWVEGKGKLQKRLSPE
jgi:hypothetical protein